MQYVLDGLGPEFDVAMVTLTCRLESKINSVTLQEAQFLLQKFEIRLERFNYIDMYNSSAHIASKSNITSTYDGVNTNTLGNQSIDKRSEPFPTGSPSLLSLGSPNCPSQTFPVPLPSTYLPFGSTAFCPRPFGSIPYI